MPDRRRTALRHPLPERTPMMLRERRSSSSGSPSPGSSSGSPNAADSPDDNPFAAPPEGRPDQPWRPRHPSRTDGDDSAQGNGDSGGPSGNGTDDRPVWGSQWSDRQPGRENGGFGRRPGGPAGQGGGPKPEGRPGGLRWDPTDPTQRRARYAVLGGMWAFFFALFDFTEIALLLGALAVYWSISALRAKPASASATGAADPGGATGRATTAQVTGADTGTADAAATLPAGAAPSVGQGSRQQTTAAVSGLVTALLALSIVATTYTVQLVYRDYYTCVNDALTKTGALACNDRLPEPLEPFFGVKK